MKRKIIQSFLSVFLLIHVQGIAQHQLSTGGIDKVGPVPPTLGIDRFYKKYLDADGIPVVSSENVSDKALLRTHRVIQTMLSKRSDVKKMMVDKGCKVMIIGKNEEVCDLPEYAHICNTSENIAYWNRRARGFGGAPEDTFSASFGEENVLCLEGDRYKGESILVHEFAHLIHAVGIVGIDAGFDSELETLHRQAIEKGLWKDTYAIINKEEYFAEAVQTFFDCNRYSEKADGVHNSIDTRRKLKDYDPGIYALLLRYFPTTDLDLCKGNFTAVNDSSLYRLYHQADEYNKRFTSKYYYGASNVQPIHASNNFIYLTRTPRGKEFYLIDTDRKTQIEAFDQKRLAAALSAKAGKQFDAYDLPFQQVRFNKQCDSIYFYVESVEYFALLSDYTVGKNRSHDRRRETYWGNIYKENSGVPVPSPDGKLEAYISEGNLWVRNRDTGELRRLSDDGSPYEYYSSNIYWSPDSRKIVSCKHRPGGDRKLLLIASSPINQLQPIKETYDYSKPGDALPIRQPVVFLLEEERSIHFDLPDVELQYSLSNIKWNRKSDYFTFDFNKRGHQQFIVYAGDIASGTLRPIVKEESDTFVYYNSLYQYWFKENNELLWISERDGWRHIYLYDTMSGKVKKQLTRGDWVVKTVIHVDEKNRRLIFKACGMDQNEDPYLEKYYILDIDNGKITALTPENAFHNVTFSHDYQFMFDIFSRVDLPPVLVIRSVEKGGKIVYQPDLQPDITEVTASGWNMPEVFSAKGRDGKTDIWGVIIRPSHFDPAKKYPVIEYIYAGPHDSHVPKGFAIEHRTSALAELGFITVMIDGMGTANRSKAFHDVCWKNLKDAGFPDRIAWMKAAAAVYPEMDLERVGIYGGSAGGQNSMGALLFHPEFYKVGVASCGCHDNRMDKIWWNEQWMGYPIGKQYEESSNVVNAHLLQGKLMLILGELDNNVDPASTLQVVDELIKHDKEFDFVMLPGVRHTLGEKYGERKRRDFFLKHLLHLDPPEWNNKEVPIKN